MLDERVGCSYPDAQQVADGTIYVIWDFMRSQEQEIWMTTFREEDVLAASEEATARVKANRRLVSKGGTPQSDETHPHPPHRAAARAAGRPCDRAERTQDRIPRQPAGH